MRTAIYSDDPDAIPALADKIDRLEAKRSRIKAYNATCRKGARDVTKLNAVEQTELVSIARNCPYMLGRHGEMPAWKLSNLGATINAARKRKAELEAVAL
jgi:hypothetical protein